MVKKTKKIPPRWYSLAAAAPPASISLNEDQDRKYRDWPSKWSASFGEFKNSFVQWNFFFALLGFKFFLMLALHFFCVISGWLFFFFFLKKMWPQNSANSAKSQNQSDWKKNPPCMAISGFFPASPASPQGPKQSSGSHGVLLLGPPHLPQIAARRADVWDGLRAPNKIRWNFFF